MTLQKLAHIRLIISHCDRKAVEREVTNIAKSIGIPSIQGEEKIVAMAVWDFTAVALALAGVMAAQCCHSGGGNIAFCSSVGGDTVSYQR